jgi:hypothetical protein
MLIHQGCTDENQTLWMMWGRFLWNAPDGAHWSRVVSQNEISAHSVVWECKISPIFSRVPSFLRRGVDLRRRVARLGEARNVGGIPFRDCSWPVNFMSSSPRSLICRLDTLSLLEFEENFDHSQIGRRPVFNASLGADVVTRSSAGIRGSTSRLTSSYAKMIKWRCRPHNWGRTGAFWRTALLKPC